MVRRFARLIEPFTLRLYHRLLLGPPPNLEGDRFIEYSWIAANMPVGPGRALDVGCGTSYMALLAARRGYETLAVDIMPVRWPYVHPRLRFEQRDILALSVTPQSFDLIINCSTIEHIGLKRYGSDLNLEADLDAMRHLRGLLRPGGIMLLTIPVGKDAVFISDHRIYGIERLPLLLDGFSIVLKEFWVKNEENKWVLVREDVALSREASRTCYGLGCFVLSRPR